jgi:hypothetical protein
MTQSPPTEALQRSYYFCVFVENSTSVDLHPTNPKRPHNVLIIRDLFVLQMPVTGVLPGKWSDFLTHWGLKISAPSKFQHHAFQCVGDSLAWPVELLTLSLCQPPFSSR